MRGQQADALGRSITYEILNKVLRSLRSSDQGRVFWVGAGIQIFRREWTAGMGEKQGTSVPGV